MLYNIGNNNPVQLLDMIAALEESLGKKAQKRFLPMQASDVPATYADIEDLVADSGYCPLTPIQKGVSSFVNWYLSYHKSFTQPNSTVLV
jgi:UDP-glucuronate 4-epimerase